MTFKQKILKYIDSFYYYINVTKRRSIYAKRLYHQKKTNIQITPLTKSQNSLLKEYWGQLNKDFHFVEYYTSVTGIFNPKYIPDDFFYSKIDPFFNNIFACKYLDDKNLYDIIFGGGENNNAPYNG